MKYDIKFKASDTLDDINLKKNVVRFLQHKYSHLDFKVRDIANGSLVILIFNDYSTDPDGELIGLEFAFDIEEKTIAKSYADTMMFINFEDDELKYLDELGFITSAQHKRHTNQDITDWF